MDANSSTHRVIPRRTVVRWLLIVTVVCAVAIFALLKFAENYVRALQALARVNPSLAAAQALSAIQIVLLSAALFSFAIGFYVAWYGFRSVRTGYFPPLRAWLLEGRPTYRGRAAITIGGLHIALGLVIVGMGCAVARYAWVVAPEMLRQQPPVAEVNPHQASPTLLQSAPLARRTASTNSIT